MNNLTEEQKLAIYQEMKAKEAQAAQQEAQNREDYKRLASESVVKTFAIITNISNELALAKKRIYEEFQTIIDLKHELFKVKSEQRSHTFMSDCGTLRITLGYNITHGYDDTAGSGEAKIKQYLANMITDEKSEQLVGLITDLLSKDKAGNYNPANIIKLQNRAEQSGDALFIDGVHIIMKAYAPQPSKTYVRAEMKSELGAWTNMPLGMTEA